MQVYSEQYVIYLRKSRSDSEKMSVEDVLKRHEKILQDYALNNLGYKIQEENIYREIVSGGEDIEERPEFLRLLKRLEIGDVRGCLVVEPQRLSRNGIYGAGNIISIFEFTNTLIVTPIKTYNLSNTMDKKYLEMIMIQSAEYLNYSKEVLARGRRSSIVEGKYIGSTPPYGYNKEKLVNEKGYKLVINPEEAEIVKHIFDLALDNVGTTNIANFLNKEKVQPRKASFFTPQMVRNILTNPTYYGMLTWERRKEVKKIIDGKITKTRPKNNDYILVKGLHTPIVSKDVFVLVQEKLKDKSTHNLKNLELKNPLASLVVCSNCKHTMIRRPYTKSFRKNNVRKYEIDKKKLLEYLRYNKKNSNLSLNDIASKLGTTKDIVSSWFPKNIDKFYPSKNLADNWYKLKDVLNIKDAKFDKEVTTYVVPSIQEDSLICSTSFCKTVSSNLKLVEEAILEALKCNLSDFNYYLDNYSKEIKKSVISKSRKLEAMSKQLDKYYKQLERAKEFYELGDYTREEYLDRKQKLSIDINNLEEEKLKIANSKEEEKYNKIKVSVPKLEMCMVEYNKLSIPDKNKMLKSIIDTIIYTKNNNKGRWNKEAEKDFTLDITLKI